MNDRRAAPRHRLNPPLACCLYVPLRQPVNVAAVENVSPGGVCFFTGEALQPGDVVGLELATAPPSLRHVVPLRVVYAQANSDGGGHLAGGQFLRSLTAAELAGLTG